MIQDESEQEEKVILAAYAAKSLRSLYENPDPYVPPVTGSYPELPAAVVSERLTASIEFKGDDVAERNKVLL
jgi:hypothetical protein